MISLLCAGCVNAANAATISNSTTATTAFTFSPEHNVQLKLTPASGLVAGSIATGVQVATGLITDSTASQLAFRFTPDTGASGKQETANTITLSGTNASNLISLELAGDSTSFRSGDAWVHTTKSMTSEPIYIKTNGAQTVNADTYTVSVDAADYAP